MLCLNAYDFRHLSLTCHAFQDVWCTEGGLWLCFYRWCACHHGGRFHGIAEVGSQESLEKGVAVEMTAKQSSWYVRKPCSDFLSYLTTTIINVFVNVCGYFYCFPIAHSSHTCLVYWCWHLCCFSVHRYQISLLSVAQNAMGSRMCMSCDVAAVNHSI